VGQSQLQFGDEAECKVSCGAGGTERSESSQGSAFQTPASPTLLQNVMVNGQPGALGGNHKDTLIIATNNVKRFEVVGQLN
jgi:hypothetical protein